MSFYEQGSHIAKVVGQGFSESSKKKTPFFFLFITPLFQITPDGKRIPVASSQFDQEVRWYMTPAAMEFFLRDLKKLGFTGKQPSDLDPSRPGFHDFFEQEIEVVNKHEAYGDQGKVSDKWSLPFEGSSQEDRPAIDLRDLNSRFGDEFKGMFGGNKKAAPPAQATTPGDVNAALDEAAEFGDDPDIPF